MTTLEIIKATTPREDHLTESVEVQVQIRRHAAEVFNASFDPSRQIILRSQIATLIFVVK